MTESSVLDRPAQTRSSELVIDLDNPSAHNLTWGQVLAVDELEGIWLVAAQEPPVQKIIRPAVVPAQKALAAPQSFAGYAVTVGAEIVAVGAGLLPSFLGKSIARSAISRMGLKPIDKL